MPGGYEEVAQPRRRKPHSRDRRAPPPTHTHTPRQRVQAASPVPTLDLALMLSFSISLTFSAFSSIFSASTLQQGTRARRGRTATLSDTRTWASYTTAMSSAAADRAAWATTHHPEHHPHCPLAAHIYIPPPPPPRKYQYQYQLAQTSSRLPPSSPCPRTVTNNGAIITTTTTTTHSFCSR